MQHSVATQQSTAQHSTAQYSAAQYTTAVLCCVTLGCSVSCGLIALHTLPIHRQAFKDTLPKGVVNFVTGSGRATLPPIMESGMIDIFAFIGGSRAADSLIKNHPSPHKLRVCLGLDAKNAGIVMPDADLDIAVKECVTGSTSYNGQRCTALKIMFVHQV